MVDLKTLVEKIKKNQVCEVLDHNVELKSSWEQEHGKRISALANAAEFTQTAFLVVGIADSGQLLSNDLKWLQATEDKISNHIRQYLSPIVVANPRGYQSEHGCFVIIEISNPDDVTEWNGKAYKRVGTQTAEMTPAEKLDLTLRLPGQDYSKRAWETSALSAPLIAQFAQKLIDNGFEGLPQDLSRLAPDEILERLRCKGKNASKILFGDTPMRVVYFDAEGDVIEQKTRDGAYYLLSDEFISQIQTWTKSRGTILHGGSIAAVSEDPYPLKALRECLANAVAHALYERENGGIIVEIFFDRMVIRNNCTLEVKKFAKEWFSKKSWSRNKLLMQILREARYTDELGTGKTRLFSQMLEAGKPEPVIEFFEKGAFGCWAVTLYNEHSNAVHMRLFERIRLSYPSLEESRLAMALILWRSQRWPDILEKLDAHYQRLATKIIRDPKSPIIVLGDEIITKRWAHTALLGQDSMAFSTHEENLIRQFLQIKAYESGRQGIFNVKEARALIGLSTTPSETTQLSNLFRKWRSQNILQDGQKRGEWRFIHPPTNPISVISSDPSPQEEDE